MNDTGLADKSVRVELCVSPNEKRLLEKAAGLANTDVAGFIRRLVIPAAETVIMTARQHRLLAEDAQLPLDLHDSPPTPTPVPITAACDK